MKRKTPPKPIRSSQTPATAAMLYEMEGRLTHLIKAENSGIKSELHRVALLVEEQNARNKFVMDGYAQIYDFLGKRKSDLNR